MKINTGIVSLPKFQDTYPKSTTVVEIDEFQNFNNTCTRDIRKLIFERHKPH